MDKQSTIDISSHSPPPTPTFNENSQSLSLFRKCYNCITGHIKGLAPFMMIMVYSVVGAWVFIAMERHNDIQEREQKRRQIEEARFILQETAFNISTNDSEIRNKSALIISAILHYENAIQFSISEETVWHFYNAILYAGSIYTTIGYGNIACKTAAGRITTIFYAIIGIPLTLSVLNQLGNFLLKFLTKSSRMISGMCKLKSPTMKKSSSSKSARDMELESSDPNDPEHAISMSGEFKTEEHNPPLLATMISMIGWLFFCAGIFCFWEPWDYFTSFYFFFISLSTIGFGDIVPDYPQYMIMNFGLVFIGLALVSVSVNVVQQKLEDIYMSILMKLLNEYMDRLSSGQGGRGAHVGLIQSWAQNRKAKWLIPLLSKGKRKLVMQRFQSEAKAQGIELPSTLTDLDPGTGLPNILTIEKKNESVQQYIDSKEHETEALMRQPARMTPLGRAADQPSPPPAEAAIADMVDTGCQTGDPIEPVDPGQLETDQFHLRETYSQTDLNGIPTEARSIQTYSSLSLLRDSGSQTLSRTMSNRVSQTSMSVWKMREASSQTLIWPVPRRCMESQTQLTETADRGLQHGVSVSSLTSIGSQTYLAHDDASAQTSSQMDLRDTDSQTLLDLAETSNQTTLSYFALREAGSQTALAPKTDSTSQTRASLMSNMSVQTRQSIYLLRECQSQTLLQTQETPVQTRQSYFDHRDSQSQTLYPESSHTAIQTPTSYFDMRSASSQTICDQTDESLQTVLEVDETASQIEPETSDVFMQVGQPFLQLRHTESQTRLDVNERDTQTWSSSIRVVNANVQAGVRTTQVGMQTLSDTRVSDSESQTGSSIFHTSESSSQTTTSPLQSAGIQTGILSRVGLGQRKSQPDSSMPSTSSGAPGMAPLFKQMSVQKMKPQLKRQLTSNAMVSGRSPIFEENPPERPSRKLGVATSEVRSTSPMPPGHGDLAGTSYTIRKSYWTLDEKGTSPVNPSEEMAAITKSLRKVQVNIEETPPSPGVPRTARSSETEPIASVKQLATEFERRRISHPRQLDLPQHFPHLRRPSFSKPTPPKSDQKSDQTKQDDQPKEDAQSKMPDDSKNQQETSEHKESDENDTRPGNDA